MNREIKFRAWDTKRKGWASNERVGIDLNGKIIDSNGTSKIDELLPNYLDEWRKILVIQQYTGLKDKNGKEIYEGDVVKFWDYDSDEDDEGSKYTTTITWSKEGGYFLEEMGWDYIPALGSDNVEVEVIGNIYENPNLIDNDAKVSPQS